MQMCFQQLRCGMDNKTFFLLFEDVPMYSINMNIVTRFYKYLSVPHHPQNIITLIITHSVIFL